MPQGGLGKKALGVAGPLLGGCAAFLVTLLLSLPSSLSGQLPESDRELFQRVCTLCHGWAVETLARGSQPLIPRRDLLRLVEYLNENYPKEPICIKPWKEDIK